MYLAALEKLNEEPEQKKFVENYIENFLDVWDEQFFKFIEEKMQDQDFIKEVRKQMNIKSSEILSNN